MKKIWAALLFIAPACQKGEQASRYRPAIASRIAEVEKHPGDGCSSLVILRAVARLETWQLREVDDARNFLERLGEPAVPCLLLALEDENRYVRTHAIEVLGRLGPAGRSAAKALARIAADPAHRAAAIEAIGKIGAAEESSLARRALFEESPEVRIAAAQTLGLLGDASAIPDLRKASERRKSDFDFFVAASASRLRLGDSEARKILESAIGDPRVDQDWLRGVLK